MIIKAAPSIGKLLLRYKSYVVALTMHFLLLRAYSGFISLKALRGHARLYVCIRMCAVSRRTSYMYIYAKRKSFLVKPDKEGSTY